MWATSRPPSPCARRQARFRAGGSNNVAGVLSCIPTPSTSPAEPFYARRSLPFSRSRGPQPRFQGWGPQMLPGCSRASRRPARALRTVPGRSRVPARTPRRCRSPLARRDWIKVSNPDSPGCGDQPPLPVSRKVTRHSEHHVFLLRINIGNRRISSR